MLMIDESVLLSLLVFLFLLPCFAAVAVFSSSSTRSIGIFYLSTDKSSV